MKSWNGDVRVEIRTNGGCLKIEPNGMTILRLSTFELLKMRIRVLKYLYAFASLGFFTPVRMMENCELKPEKRHTKK